jgi:hypothetical protein
MARSDGYVMQHRLVMAEWIGRALARTAYVHHKDHDPLNNMRENLELWPDNRSHKLAAHGKIAVGIANRWRPWWLASRAKSVAVSEGSLWNRTVGCATASPCMQGLQLSHRVNSAGQQLISQVQIRRTATLTNRIG